ncbi:P-loop containing nucleoside triphosphate hydrolase protein [Fennellomyces sp. T-0311]|nr:P-loop containing nucleoside triphosphate hydrolase protein [Fennellomyces sp. T-0311]
MMIRPRSLNLTPTSSFSSATTATSSVVGPVSPPATPLLPASPDSTVSPSLFPSPSSSSRSMSIRENVQVMVRLRPPSSTERDKEKESCWQLGPDPGMIRLPQHRNGTCVFQYDAVVSGVDNKLVYDAGVGDLVRSTMAGYNGTVFAYGQTASGKTYTMTGPSEQPGVIPRAINELFTYIEENPGREFMLRVSYLEIYKEKIRDLIGEPGDLDPEIREDKKRGVYVRNLREVIVNSADQVLAVIKKGEHNRHISATDYNEHSSRSHTILQIVIESRTKNNFLPDQASVRVSQLNLIDLAGSEKATSNAERRQEGGYINKSLLSLGNVISQILQKMNNEKVHVQYRSSTLTRVLQTALSGNARISIICTINPLWRSKDESLNTLRFAQRAKQIRTAAKMTRINEHSELQKCLTTIAELQTRMQEKTEQEVETRERLSQLLGLILTSSKNAPPTVAALSKLADRVVSNDSVLSHSTMREVFAQCEQGLTQHREEMLHLKASLDSARKTQAEQAANIAEQEQRIETYIESIADLEKELSESMRDRDEYAQQIDEYKAHIKELTSRMASLENELITSKEQHEDLVQVIVSKDVDADERVIELKKVVESLEAQVAESQELTECQSHENGLRVAELESQLAACVQALEEKTQIIARYQEAELQVEQKEVDYLKIVEQIKQEIQAKEEEQPKQEILVKEEEQVQHEESEEIKEVEQEEQQKEQVTEIPLATKTKLYQPNIPLFHGGAWSIIAAAAVYAYSISS